MDSDFDLLTAKAMLEWQEELGISEAISEKPINRFDTKKNRRFQDKSSKKY
jgi:DNA polymerase